MITAISVNVGRDGYQYAADLGRKTRGIKIINLSKSSALVVYPGGGPPTTDERLFGASRQHQMIAPGGWLSTSLMGGSFALGADGYLKGDTTLGYVSELSENVPCVIEEYTTQTPEITYAPPRLTIAKWASKAFTPASGVVLLSALDPTYKVPQMRGGKLLFIAGSETSGGTDGYQSLCARYKLRSAINDSERNYIPVGGGNIGGNMFTQEVYFDADLLEELHLYTTETGSRRMSGQLIWINTHINKKTYVCADFMDLLIGMTGGIRRISSSHLTKAVITWKQAGAGAGLITIKHYDTNGTLLVTDTITATAGGSGSSNIEPKAAFMDIATTAGSGGALDYTIMLDRLYQI